VLANEDQEQPARNKRKSRPLLLAYDAANSGFGGERCTYENDRQPTRLRKSTTASPSQRGTEGEPAVRAIAGRRASPAKVKGQARSAKRKTETEEWRVRTRGKESLRRMDNAPMSESARAICEDCVEGAGGSMRHGREYMSWYAR
jgi:hypothetical protein